MLRTLARLAVGLSLLCVAACGIESNDDLTTKLKPLTPLQGGTYVGASKEDKPFTLARQGNFYTMESKDDDANVHRARIHFYQIPDFDGYIMQLSVLDPAPGDSSKKHLYLFARVKQEQLVVYDENIEHAVLPPHLAALFEHYNPKTGTTGPIDRKVPAANKAGETDEDKSAAEPEFRRTDKLRDGQSVLFVLRALAVARYPLTEMLSIKRVR